MVLGESGVIIINKIYRLCPPPQNSSHRTNIFCHIAQCAVVFDIWLGEDLTPQGGRTVILTKGEEKEEGGEIREEEQHGWTEVRL